MSLVYWKLDEDFKLDFRHWVSYAVMNFPDPDAPLPNTLVQQWFVEVRRSLVSYECSFSARVALTAIAPPQHEYKQSEYFVARDFEIVMLKLRLFLAEEWRDEWYHLARTLRPNFAAVPVEAA